MQDQTIKSHYVQNDYHWQASLDLEGCSREEIKKDMHIPAKETCGFQQDTSWALREALEDTF